MKVYSQDRKNKFLEDYGFCEWFMKYYGPKNVRDDDERIKYPIVKTGQYKMEPFIVTENRRTFVIEACGFKKRFNDSHAASLWLYNEIIKKNDLKPYKLDLWGKKK